MKQTQINFLCLAILGLAFWKLNDYGTQQAKLTQDRKVAQDKSVKDDLRGTKVWWNVSQLPAGCMSEAFELKDYLTMVCGLDFRSVKVEGARFEFVRSGEDLMVHDLDKDGKRADSFLIDLPFVDHFEVGNRLKRRLELTK